MAKLSFINYSSKEVNCKIVYYGTGLSGKTTNVQYIYDTINDGHRGKLVSLSNENERTLFFDFLPLTVGEIRGFKTRFHLYTIPGQTFYDTSRDFILKGVDGIVFVVDSQPERMEENIESFEMLEASIRRLGYDINQLPIVYQYNKRDLDNTVSITELEATFNPNGKPYLEATSSNGVGVTETLEKITELVIRDLKGGTQL